MKKQRFSLVKLLIQMALSLVLVLCLTFLVVIPDLSTKSYTLNSINHRGHYLAPENTLAAFRLSKQKGFKMVECDVSFTKDNVPVLLHDKTVDRTSNYDELTGNKNTKINDLNLEEIRKYDFGSYKGDGFAGEKIPTFEEFILLCIELELHPYIELKEATTSQVETIYNIVQKHNMLGNVTFISFYLSSLRAITSLNKSVRVGYLINKNVTNKINEAMSLKTGDNEVFVDVKYTLASEIVIKACKKNDLKIEVWTVNSKADIKLLNNYISGVTSDYLIASDILK